MNANIIQRVEIPYRHLHHTPGSHTHSPPRQLWSHAMSRRQFARAALGTLAVGAAFSTGFWKPGLAFAHQSSSPVPIPGGSPALGGGFHVFGPGPNPPVVGLDPIDAEPSTITDFNGFVGLAYISGTVRQTNTATGEVQTLPFVDSDMRFMKGVFRGTDGETHRGAFALV
jgi:hypothetical protein